ncbi:hypothetical protein M9458_050446, partial [Cirrhinus mrigala]
IETLGGQKTEDADKNGEDQTPRDDKEEKEENTVIDSPNTGSPDATLPCHTRPNTPKESITDKKWDQDSESENAGETHEGQKLLKTSPQSIITGKNNDDTGNTNEGDEVEGDDADEVEENANSKPDETDREIESQKSLQTQEEREKESPILKNDSENEENSSEEQIETLGEQETEDADKNKKDQTPGDKKGEEEENTVIDSPNT